MTACELACRPAAPAGSQADGDRLRRTTERKRGRALAGWLLGCRSNRGAALRLLALLLLQLATRRGAGLRASPARGPARM